MRRVILDVDRPSCIEQLGRETVRLERLTPLADGYVAEPYGALLAPGGTQVPLEPGLYHVRTLEDAELRVIAGGVQVTSPDPDDLQRHVNVYDQFHDLVTRLAAADGTLAAARVCDSRHRARP